MGVSVLPPAGAPPSKPRGKMGSLQMVARVQMLVAKAFSRAAVDIEKFWSHWASKKNGANHT
eukprot:8145538-Pyramimonas_sp.AAC.1